jgi:hypothetical protein
MTTPEGKVKERLKKLLKKYGVYYHMPVMNGMGAPTLDFICCYKGRYLAIETKAPGQKPTKRQQLTMQQMAAAGGFVFTVANDDDFEYLEGYLKFLP